MKPDWDKLIKAFKDSDTTLVADVDCTAAGKPLCDQAGVRGYPTIKHGDVNNLEDYKGGRDFASLEKFAKGLKPVCSPAKMDLCEPEMKEKILELQKLSAADLDTQIKEKEAEIEKAEKFFTDEVDKLQKTYQKLQEDKEATVTAVKDSGLGLMKSVKAAAGKAEL
jgi:DNA repair exonuclease SbcCD ATPase subunit